MSQNDFDFMLGNWDGGVTRYAEDGAVTQEAKGTWSAKASFGGKVIEDKFVQQVDGGDDVAAFTLRTWCEATQQWEMVFLWADQPASGVISFVGRRVDEEMHLRVQQIGSDGRVVLARVRFFEITAEGFRWTHHKSNDNGETWYPLAAFEMQRKSD
jgi:hypothetical protein